MVPTRNGCNAHWQVGMMPRWAGLLATLLLVVMAGCSTMTSTPSISADATQGWALLPINNLSDTPQADSQALIMLETQLRTKGVQHVSAYAPLQAVSLRALLDPARQLNEAMDWARQSGYRYGLAGTINEWNYRSGADKEPVVGMNMKLVDIATGKVLWQANAARTGWGYASLPALADKVIADLLEGVQFNHVSP